jgi:lysophospholipase L1-like esterase
MATLSYYDGSSEKQLTESDLTYFNGSSTTTFGTGRRLSFWNGTTEIPLLGSITVAPPASGPLTRATMPSVSEAWNNAAAPTVTTSASQTISGTLYTPASSGLFKVLGTKTLVSAGTGWWRAKYMADSPTKVAGDPFYLPSYGLRFVTTSASIEFKVRQRPDISSADTGKIYARMPIRIKINGQWTSDYPTYIGAGNTGYADVTAPSSISAGTVQFVKITFASATARTVEVFTMGEFGGIVSTSAISASASTPAHTAVMLGDSLTGAEKHGTGNWSLSSSQGNQHKATYTQLSSLWAYACQSIGYDNVVTSSSGSSGFRVAGDTPAYSFTDRIDEDVIDHQPELVMVGTSFNDLSDGVSASVVAERATFTVDRIKAAPDSAPIIVILGNPDAPIVRAMLGASAETVVAEYNNALRSVAKEQAVWFLNPWYGTLYNPAGTLVYTDSNGGLLNGNSQYVSSDGTHPTQQGAMIFGKKIAEFLRLAHPVS